MRSSPTAMTASSFVSSVPGDVSVLGLFPRVPVAEVKETEQIATQTTSGKITAVIGYRRHRTFACMSVTRGSLLVLFTSHPLRAPRRVALAGEKLHVRNASSKKNTIFRQLCTEHLFA